MSEGVAVLIVAAVAVAALAAWLAGVAAYLRMRRFPAVTTASTVIRGVDRERAQRTLFAAALGRQWQLVERTGEGATFRLPMATLTVSLRQRATGVEVATQAHLADRGYRWVMAALVLVVAPAVVAGVTALVWLLAARSEDPGIRWQTVQMVQVIHVLWPPFLIAALHKRLRDTVTGTAELLPALIEAGV